jgi:hypothetical protein
MMWPQGWREVSLLEVCTLNPRFTSEQKPAEQTPVTFVPMSAVDEITGRITTPETRPFAEVQKAYTPFRKGDVLFAKVTPCMENGKAAVVGRSEPRPRLWFDRISRPAARSAVAAARVFIPLHPACVVSQACRRCLCGHGRVAARSG